jgi:basic amino acid/polyamine antiporter, APA family
VPADPTLRPHAPGAERDDDDGPLRRAITPKLLLLFIVGDILGGGIYALVGEVGAETGGAIWAAFMLALVMAAFTAGSYAELVSKYPRAGGAGLYVHRAFGNPFLSFIVAFAVVVSGITSASALSRAFGGDYLSVFVDVKVVVAALGLLALIALVNFRGIAESVKLNVGFTLIEIGGLLLIVLIAVVAVGDGDADVGRAFEFKEGSSVFAAALAGAALAFYALVGFEDSVNVAEEAQDPRRTYPRVLFGGLAIAGVLYLLVTIGASVVVPTNDLASSSGPLLEVVKQGPLDIPEKLFSAIGLFALANGALINMIMASRLLYGMAEEGVVPRPLGIVHATRRTPWVAILFTSAIAVVLITTADLEKLADTTVALLVMVFAVVNATVLYLRRDPVEHDHFRVPSIVPVIGIGVSIALLTQIEGKVFLRAGILVGIGVVLWVINALLVRREDRPAAGRAGPPRAD